MGKSGRKLQLGMTILRVGTEKMTYEVCGGRWTGGDKADEDCAVIVQDRSKGSLGASSRFKMAICPLVVERIRSGLGIWSGHYRDKTLDCLFDDVEMEDC